MTDYNAWTLSIARCFCTSPAPCDMCMEAARRVVIRRRELRTILTSFALDEADLLVECEIVEPDDDLMPDPTAITSSDLKTMVMQEDDQ